MTYTSYSAGSPLVMKLTMITSDCLLEAAAARAASSLARPMVSVGALRSEDRDWRMDRMLAQDWLAWRFSRNSQMAWADVQSARSL